MILSILALVIFVFCVIFLILEYATPPAEPTATIKVRSIDQLMKEIKANAISVTPVRYSDFIVPQKHTYETTITEMKPRPFYRAARPAKRWKK